MGRGRIWGNVEEEETKGEIPDLDTDRVLSYFEQHSLNAKGAISRPNF